jgi:GDP/UDP-N,N'-diacetylbacillosamine 2-epimerase (hydrolysing)
MGGAQMRIIVLTSSRADYSIYLPLLKKLNADQQFDLNLIVFGTHLSKGHGHTVDEIEKDGFKITYRISTIPSNDSAQMISESMGNTISQFSKIWESEKETTDLVFCLGDRYEMFAAIAASVPFNLSIAHLHGGETTLGAIDNSFRHSITTMSKYHFVSTRKNAERVEQITGSDKNIYHVGAMSLDNLKEIVLFTKEEFKNKFSIFPENPILVTFHPETISYDRNEEYTNELISALSEIDQQIIITMPNTDTGNISIRNKLIRFAADKKNVFTVESLGTRGYFSCIEFSDFLLGNSSSGIIEAASFGKYVINLGDRQKGRETGKNVIHCSFNKNDILDAIRRVKNLPAADKTNIYGDGNTSEKIISILKKIH